MAGLCWMAVTLAFFLSVQNTLAVDQNRLATFVNGILGQYGPEGMSSLAVSIPEDQNRRPTDILKEVYESDPRNKVLEKLNNDQVYIGNRVVAAKVLKQARGAVRAESFVFSKIFKPNNGLSNTEEELRGVLTRFGSKIGLGNKFRCDRRAGRMQCTTCYGNNQVTVSCVSGDSQPGPNQSQPQRGSSGTAQGVQSRSGRYKRSGGWSHSAGWSHGGESVNSAGWSFGGGGSLSETSGHAGGLSSSSGWGHNGGGSSVSGGWTLSGHGRHSASWSPSGGSTFSAVRGHGAGYSHSSGWGRNRRRNRRIIIIRAE